MSRAAFFPKISGDSICTDCFLTITATDLHPTLRLAELAHRCPPRFYDQLLSADSLFTVPQEKTTVGS